MGLRTARNIGKIKAQVKATEGGGLGDAVMPSAVTLTGEGGTVGPAERDSAGA